MPAAGHVTVRGLRELNRAFDQMGKELKKELRDELKTVGEPVRQAAEQLAVANIRNVDQRWSAMRLGTTSRVVFVAPKARRRRGTPRPNFGNLLLNRAMLPALEANEPKVIRGLEQMLDRVGEKGGF